MKNPVTVAQVDTPGEATRVSFTGNLVAVVDGGAGLAIVDIADPPASRIIFQISPVILGSTPIAIATRGDIAYVGLNNGRLITVDLASGTLLDSIDIDSTSNERIVDLLITGDHLYILTRSELRIVAVGPLVTGSFGSVKSPFFIDPNRRIFVGDQVAFAVHGKGINTFDVSNPSEPRQLTVTNSAQLGWKHLAMNGSGIGIAAVSPNRLFDGPHHVSIYNFRDPSKTEELITTFQTPGVARAITIFNGLAYVADHNNGLQVINYLGIENEKDPPSISLSASFPLTTSTDGTITGVAEEGKLVRVTATVTDDVQVRNVEFNLDGNKVATDGNFPFEFFFVTPRRTDQLSFRISARASDTVGNATLSSDIVVTLVDDATPPRVSRVVPNQGTLLGKIRTISAFFNEPMAADTLNLDSFTLMEAGIDGLLDTSDDVFIQDGMIEWREELLGVFMEFPSGFAAGHYLARISNSAADIKGNNLQKDEVWGFRVFNIADDRDGDGIPDLVEETVAGLDPDNPDSDGDGEFDGNENFDNDQLTNIEEVILGTILTDDDSDDDGVKDGEEDTDGDNLLDISEILIHGTDLNNPDTDGDKFEDGEEIAHQSNPLDAESLPISDTGFVVGNILSVQNFIDPGAHIGISVGSNVSVRNNADPSVQVGNAVGVNLSIENIVDPSTQNGKSVGQNFSVNNVTDPSVQIGIAVGLNSSVQNLADPSVQIGESVGLNFSIENQAHPETILGKTGPNVFSTENSVE